jgi:hypothetical protein
MTFAVLLCIWWTLLAGGINIVTAFTREPDRWSLFYLLVGVGLVAVGTLAL